jgi:CRISPR-associated protein Cas2
MFIVVSYDVKETRRRTKVCNTLKDYGTRVQYSVFECLLDHKNFVRLHAKLVRAINEDEDTLRIYQLCESCKKKAVVYGNVKITEDNEVYIV